MDPLSSELGQEREICIVTKMKLSKDWVLYNKYIKIKG